MDSFGQLIRRVWSRGLFRVQISPHEMLQAISVESKKYFESRNYEPIEFLSWFLNSLHKNLGGTKKAGSSVIHECFQGVVQVKTYKKKKTKKIDYDDDNDNNEKEEIEDNIDEDDEHPIFEGYEAKPDISYTPFLHLSLDVPPPPVFTSETERDIIPQVPIYELLQKFDGNTVQHIASTSQKKQYTIISLPKYLIFHIKRFTRNQYFTEKNHTIVNFPMKELDVGNCMFLFLLYNNFNFKFNRILILLF